MSREVVVQFDGVSKSFGSLKVLDEISFDVGRGEAFCILGRSGSGKSVTVRQMIGLIKRPMFRPMFSRGNNCCQ